MGKSYLDGFETESAKKCWDLLKQLRLDVRSVRMLLSADVTTHIPSNNFKATPKVQKPNLFSKL